MPPQRPEFENPPELFYNDREARQYHVSTRIRTVQRAMTLRALELLNLPPGPSGRAAGALVLDVGCGSGISGEVLAESGHTWVGVDVSADMLGIAKAGELRYYGVPLPGERGAAAEDRWYANSATRVDTSHVRFGQIDEDDEDEEEEEEEEENDEEEEGGGGGEASHVAEVALNDIGEGVPFRPGSFDGCISVSVIQWLCHSSRKGEVPQRRLMAFFQSVYNALRRGARAVMQFYPSDPAQVNMITRAAMKCGFSGGVVVDFPHSSKARKHYLVLQAGQVAGGFVPPAALTDDAAAEDSDSDDEENEGEDDEDDEEEEEDEEARTHVRVGGRERGKRPRSASSARGGPRAKRRRKDNRPVTGTKEWVLLKKEERRRRGEKTTADSKYTMRPRKPRF